MCPQRRAILAVDLGGSKYIGGLIAKNGEILYKKRHVWRSYALDEVFADICNAIDDVLDHCPEYDIEALGMTIPGLADPHKGIFLNSSAMGIHNWPIGEIIRDKYRWPVFLDNDGRACAMAERYFGAGQGCDDYLYITVSNGVGGALVLGGELYFGAYGNAGEIGQCIVEDHIETSRSGRVGTLEEHANARGIVANYLHLGGQQVIDGEPASGKSIALLARNGDMCAQRAYELEGYYLGKAIAGVYNVLDISKVIIGGGLSLGYDLFERVLAKTVRAYSYTRSTPFLEIVPTPLKYEGALIGAASLALRGLRQKV